MRWKLLPVAACAVCLGLTAACVSKSDMEKMWDTGYTGKDATGHDVPYQGMRPFVIHLAVAVCQLESKQPAGSLDDTKSQCPGGTEGSTPPPYPPK
jgi:hypothetical protein